MKCVAHCQKWKDHCVPLIWQRQDIKQMIKHENLAKVANLGMDQNENFKCQIFRWKHFILTPSKEAENRFSISCLFCATALTGVVLELFYSSSLHTVSAKRNANF